MPEALNHPLTELISDAKAIPEKLLLEPLDEDFLILKFTIKKPTPRLIKLETKSSSHCVVNFPEPSKLLEESPSFTILNFNVLGGDMSLLAPPNPKLILLLGMDPLPLYQSLISLYMY